MGFSWAVSSGALKYSKLTTYKRYLRVGEGEGSSLLADWTNVAHCQLVFPQRDPPPRISVSFYVSIRTAIRRQARPEVRLLAVRSDSITGSFQGV